jgi:hypothetical protein
LLHSTLVHFFVNSDKRWLPALFHCDSSGPYINCWKESASVFLPYYKCQQCLTVPLTTYWPWHSWGDSTNYGVWYLGSWGEDSTDCGLWWHATPFRSIQQMHQCVPLLGLVFLYLFRFSQDCKLMGSDKISSGIYVPGLLCVLKVRAPLCVSFYFVFLQPYTSGVFLRAFLCVMSQTGISLWCHLCSKK